MHKTLKITLTACLALIAFVLTTQPAKLPLIALMIPFALLFVVLAGIIVTLLGLADTPLSLRMMRGSVVGALLPVLLLVLRSIGQLTLRDTLIIFLLFGLVYFYLARLARPVAP